MITFNKDIFFTSNLSKHKVKKKQIILINTESSIEHFLAKITNRYNKKYDKVPAFTIDRSGIVYQHYNPLFSSKILGDEMDTTAIVIALENVGWLTYDETTQTYLDWKRQPYTDEITEKSWRNKKFWATYNNTQVQKLVELVDYLCMEYSINKSFIGNNVTTHKPETFKGVLNRSNVSKNHYDLSPAMDFDRLTELINT